MEKIILELTVKIKRLEDKIIELESNTGGVNSIDVGVNFPEHPHNNQIFCITEDTPPNGGTLYRYDSNSASWLNLTI